jgi:hypothetical protein
VRKPAFRHFSNATMRGLSAPSSSPEDIFELEKAGVGFPFLRLLNIPDGGARSGCPLTDMGG